MHANAPGKHVTVRQSGFEADIAAKGYKIMAVA
jgi:hypothetical protein